MPGKSNGLPVLLVCIIVIGMLAGVAQLHVASAARDEADTVPQQLVNSFVYVRQPGTDLCFAVTNTKSITPYANPSQALITYVPCDKVPSGLLPKTRSAHP